MKRAIAFVTALVIAAGAVAPAASVFAADLPAVPTNSDNLSIWDTSTSTPDNPYNTTDVFNSVNDMWGDLFDDGRFNNTTVSDFQRSYVEWAITKYIEASPDEEVNGVTVSYFDDIVDYICAHPSDFDIYWTPEALSLALAGNPYGMLNLGDDFFDNLKDYVLTNYYTTPSSVTITINGHIWVASPILIRTQYVNYTVTGTDTGASIYCSRYGDRLILCAVGTYSTTTGNGYYHSSGSVSSPPYAFAGSYTTGNIYATTYDSNYNVIPANPYLITSQYSSAQSAIDDFFNYTGSFSSGEPVSNGKVYIRDVPLGGDTLNFSYPAYPVSNSKAVSNYYFNSYGDTWEDNSTVIDDTVYNNNLTTLYPVTYDNNIPLWLIQSNSSIETFDYSLELPSAPLATLPSDFEGGGSFFQNSFVVLGGFGAFVLVGLSFSLVGLFFKE